MKRSLAALAVLGLGAALGWGVTTPPGLSPQDEAALAAHTPDATRGEQVFWAAGCAGCHSAPTVSIADPAERWQVLAGGRRFATDFGTFIAPNISMDPAQGIGAWQAADFLRAVRHGVSPEGAYYYPAFPVTAYARATPEDILDLWAYWQGLPADATPSAAHQIGFPFTLRRGLAAWRWLYGGNDPLPVIADEQVARGQYLAETLGHCGECHRPRDAFGGQDRTAGYAGGAFPAGEGRIPPLPPEGWSALDIAAYLQTGFTPEFDVVGGAMAEVIASYRNLPAAETEAIAAYLISLRSTPSQ